MKTPRTTSAVEHGGTNGVNAAFSADVMAFAAANKVEDFLQPLLEATQRIFPTARFVKVRMDDDPELPNERHILYHVQAAGFDQTAARTAGRQWNEESARICSASLACIFRLRMDLKR